MLFADRNLAQIILPCSNQEDIEKKFKSGIIKGNIYKVYSLDDNLEIIEGVGKIDDFRFFNYAATKRCGDVRDEMFFKTTFTFESESKKNSGIIEWKGNGVHKWWTKSYQEAITVRQQSIEKLIDLYEEKIHALKLKTNLFEKVVIVEKYLK